MNFGTLAIYSEKTMYLNIENIGKFRLQYTIDISNRKLPTIYMVQILDIDVQKKQSLTSKKSSSKKGKNPSSTDRLDTK